MAENCNTGRPLPDDELLRRVKVYKEHGNNLTATARALGLDRKWLRENMRRAAARGLLLDHEPAMPGFEITKVATELDADGNKLGDHITQKREPGDVFEMPKTHALAKMTVQRDPEGRIIQDWIRAVPTERDPAQIADILKGAFKDYVPFATPVPKPAAYKSSLLTLMPANDWHVGMYAWEKEVGTNWDLKIAEKVIGRAAEEVVERSPRSSIFALLGGGDLLHADNYENRTARSGNSLQVDGRYPKVVATAARLMVRTADLALARNDRVIIRILPGNHDEHTAVAIAYFMLAWYRNEPRVTIDVDPSLFWWYRFGQVMLGATHGHTVKIAQMPAIMASRRAEDWGATKFRYVHGFHLHHSAKIATEGNGVICETHQAPIPQDAWHFGSGFISGRSLQTITYHKSLGEIGRVRTAILDR